MNADEAKRDAIHSLAARLRAWGIEEHYKLAEAYVADMALAGWVWMPPNNRPRGPKPEEACRTCGRHLHPADVVCDTPTTRPIPLPADTSARVAALRSNVVPMRAKTDPSDPTKGDAS